MKPIFLKACTLFMTLSLLSCLGGAEQSKSEEESTNATASNNEALASKAADLAETLCEEFPEALILKYNPDGLCIESERVEYKPGVLDHCKIKLFYGKKDYEFYEGQVGAWAPKTENPLWQYDPKRNANMYHAVDGLGEKAVFLTAVNQLLILKDGIIYNINPPNRRGTTTNSGKAVKEIAIEMAEHYGI
ncbi:hypothetical protein [Gilvibacter sediminis]|uniref:hypothetical protein n=1 Tax=Gilvibacter sediminis TaxID=379071 RepID=UPI0023504300|nr:hypothetical protein [Gilvibacter sediminis]MDC7996685.1 hypothetical protein [Gilvibacter sediminis]